MLIKLVFNVNNITPSVKHLVCVIIHYKAGFIHQLCNLHGPTLSIFYKREPNLFGSFEVLLQTGQVTFFVNIAFFI